MSENDPVPSGGGVKGRVGFLSYRCILTGGIRPLVSALPIPKFSLPHALLCSREHAAIAGSVSIRRAAPQPSQYRLPPPPPRPWPRWRKLVVAHTVRPIEFAGPASERGTPKKCSAENTTRAQKQRPDELDELSRAVRTLSRVSTRPQHVARTSFRDELVVDTETRPD